MPAIVPVLKNVPIFLYLKIILFLATLLLITCFLVLVFYKKSKEFKPFKMKGKYKGFKWVADIKEYDPHRGWNIWINFVCPVHDVYLGRKDAEIPECCNGVLWCKHCNKKYPIYVRGDIIHLEEAQKVIEDDVISKLRVDSKSFK
ncbi:MAG: hypothetical protein V1933_06060 [Candidatus Omnitrophota bacterium]